jgi:hypothetical protein
VVLVPRYRGVSRCQCVSEVSMVERRCRYSDEALWTLQLDIISFICHGSSAPTRDYRLICSLYPWEESAREAGDRERDSGRFLCRQAVLGVSELHS